jgi:hypothetical protein
MTARDDLAVGPAIRNRDNLPTRIHILRGMWPSVHSFACGPLPGAAELPCSLCPAAPDSAAERGDPA